MNQREEERKPARGSMVRGEDGVVDG